MAKLFGVIPYGGGSTLGEFVKDVGTVGEGFMGAAVESAQAEDAREAAIADKVTEATLNAAFELDSKYPAFQKNEDLKIKRYEVLAKSYSPDIAAALYDSGQLERKDWMEFAQSIAMHPNNKDFKYTGSVSPYEQYEQNITDYRSQVENKLSDYQGPHMTGLFVSQSSIPDRNAQSDQPQGFQGGNIGTTTGATIGADTTNTADMAGGSPLYIPAKPSNKSFKEQTIVKWNNMLAMGEADLSKFTSLEQSVIQDMSGWSKAFAESYESIRSKNQGWTKAYMDNITAINNLSNEEWVANASKDDKDNASAAMNNFNTMNENLTQMASDMTEYYIASSTVGATDALSNAPQEPQWMPVTNQEGQGMFDGNLLFMKLNPQTNAYDYAIIQDGEIVQLKLDGNNNLTY